MANDKEICPICEKGHLINKKDVNEAEMYGVRSKIPIHFSYCDKCGCPNVSTEQSDMNSNEYKMFTESVKKTLTIVDVYDVGNNCYISIQTPVKDYFILANEDLLNKLDLAMWRYREEQRNRDI